MNLLGSRAFGNAQRRRWSFGIAFGVLLLALAIGQARGADYLASAPGSDASEAQLPSGLRVAASNGYVLYVWSQAPGEVVFTTSHGSTEVTYAVHGLWDGHRLKVNAGSVGRVDMTFLPAGVENLSGDGCRNVAKRVVGGEFNGLLEFHDEGGLTSAQVRHAEPIYGEPPTPLVTWSKSQPGALFHVNQMALHGKDSALSFWAFGGRPGARKGFGAAIAYRRDGRDVRRSIVVYGGPRTLSYSGSLDEAVLRPPSPFQGEARYRRSSSRRESWTGALRVKFPGGPTRSLLGGNLFTSASREGERICR